MNFLSSFCIYCVNSHIYSTMGFNMVCNTSYFPCVYVWNCINMIFYRICMLFCPTRDWPKYADVSVQSKCCKAHAYYTTYMYISNETFIQMCVLAAREKNHVQAMSNPRQVNSWAKIEYTVGALGWRRNTALAHKHSHNDKYCAHDIFFSCAVNLFAIREFVSHCDHISIVCEFCVAIYHRS